MRRFFTLARLALNTNNMSQLHRVLFYFVIAPTLASPWALGAGAHSTMACDAVLSDLKSLSPKESPLPIKVAPDMKVTGDPITAINAHERFEIRFQTLAALIDFQNIHPEFAGKIHERTETFVFQMDEAYKTIFLRDLEKYTNHSMKGSLRLRHFNTLYLGVFTPLSAFAQMSAAAKWSLPAKEVESRLDQEIYLSFNEDGSLSLRNFGYREFMKKKLLAAVGPAHHLKVFRGMNSTQAAFVDFAGKFARGEKTQASREQLMESMRRHDSDFDISGSDEQLLRRAHAQLFTRFGYIFTTPDPMWAAHWGDVYELQVDVHALPESFSNKIYVATDSTHNLEGSVIEIDFPMQTFDEALHFAKHTSSKLADKNHLKNRVTPNGQEILPQNDLRNVPLSETY